MDSVDVFLFFVVAFSVILFLILDSIKESTKTTTELISEKPEEEEERENQVCDSDDDDWEGIERTELERRFGEAVVYVSNATADDYGRIDGDLKLQLYGLQKLALQGPCHGSNSQPILFNRAKWNAWQKLGNMSREMAMEKYIHIIDKAIPGWNQGLSSSEDWLILTKQYRVDPLSIVKKCLAGD